MISRFWIATLLGPLWLACGGSTPSASKVPADHAAPVDSERTSAKVEADSPPGEPSETASATDDAVPTECAHRDPPCRPPSKWVEKLCADVHPGLALYMFQSGQPWERLYLRGKTAAINASGGATMEGWLEFDEEVLMLRMRRADPNGIQVSGATESYEALRWDGSCVSLSGGEVTTSRPPSPKNSAVTWRFLDPNIQEALKEDEVVREGYRTRQRECKGATMGQVSAACEKADKKLSVLVAESVRRGTKIPLPQKLP